MGTYEWVQVSLTAALVLVTGVYVAFTHGLVSAARKQAQRASGPLLGIRLLSIRLSDPSPEVDGKRVALVICEVASIGNSPAVEVRLDAVLSIPGRTNAPARDFAPHRFAEIPYLRSGEILRVDELGLGFDAVSAFLLDIVQWDRELEEREDLSDEPPSATLTLYAYYSNGYGQEYESKHGVWLRLYGDHHEEIDDQGRCAAEGSVDLITYDGAQPFTTQLVTREAANRALESRQGFRG